MPIGRTDTITGGNGSDELTGNAGDNRFVFNGAAASTDVGNTITDFDLAGTANVIDFITNAAAGTGVTAAAFGAQDLAVGVSGTTDDGFNFVTSANGNDPVDLTVANVAAFFLDVDGAGGNTFEFANADNDVYVAVTDGTDLGIYLAESGGGNTVITAGELTLIATLEGVTTIAAANLVDFA